MKAKLHTRMNIIWITRQLISGLYLNIYTSAIPVTLSCELPTDLKMIVPTVYNTTEPLLCWNMLLLTERKVTCGT